MVRFCDTDRNTAFNVFMHVAIYATTGQFRVLSPVSIAGDFVSLRAEMPLVEGMTACSAGQSGNFCVKPIDFQVMRYGKQKEVPIGAMEECHE